LYLGKASFSRIKVSNPCKAAVRAAADPAGPPPTTIRSYIADRRLCVETLITFYSKMHS
jgi:hypothetical protein